MAFIKFPSHIIARNFELHTLILCLPAVFQVKFLFARICYHNLIKFAHAFPHYSHTMVQSMTCMESHYSMVFWWLACYHKLLWNFLWLSCFHRSPYMTFYDIPVFCIVVNPGNVVRTLIIHPTLLITNKVVFHYFLTWICWTTRPHQKPFKNRLLK